MNIYQMRVIRYILTVRRLIEEEKKKLYDSMNNQNREQVIKRFGQWYGQDIEYTTTRSYQIMKDGRRLMIMTTNINCIICNKMFTLDEEFLHIDFNDIELDDTFHFSTHRECLKKLVD